MRVTTGGSASEMRERTVSSSMRGPISRLGLVAMVSALDCEWVSAPVLVDEVFGGVLADCAKPLGTVCGHPNEVARFYRIPGIAKAVDAAAFEHQQAMLH